MLTCDRCLQGKHTRCECTGCACSICRTQSRGRPSPSKRASPVARASDGEPLVSRPPDRRQYNEGRKSEVPPTIEKVVIDGLLRRENQSALAREYGISRSQVRSIAERAGIISRKPSLRKAGEAALPRYYPEGTGAKWRRSPT